MTDGVRQLRSRKSVPEIVQTLLSALLSVIGLLAACIVVGVAFVIVVRRNRKYAEERHDDVFE